jgi:hypothetical protein
MASLKLSPLIAMLIMSACSNVGEVITEKTFDSPSNLPPDPNPPKMHEGGIIKYRIKPKDLKYNYEAHLRAFGKAQNNCYPNFMDPQKDEWRDAKDKKALMKKKRVLLFIYKCNIS